MSGEAMVTRASYDALVEVLDEAAKCFMAAEAEGLMQAVIDEDGKKLADLVLRRLLFAQAEIVNAPIILGIPDPLKMLAKDEADLIPCAGGCGLKLDPRAGNKPGDKCALCDPAGAPQKTHP